MMEPITATMGCPKGMWIGVDFDGTLVEYKSGTILNGPKDFPPEVPLMVKRVKEWIGAGIEVRIFTSRASDTYPDQKDLAIALIEGWCLAHLGKVLEVTCVKDALLYQFWDDRAIQVRQNEGKPYCTKSTVLAHESQREVEELEQILQSTVEERDDLAQKYHDACNQLQALQLRKEAPIPKDDSPFSEPVSVPDILMQCADTYKERNPLYGDAYKRHGAIMSAFFDKGLHIEAGDIGAFTRLGILNMLMSKLARYTAQPKGHKDSAHDSVVYNAMLEEVTPQ